MKRKRNDRMFGEVHVISQAGRLPRDDHDAIILQAVNVTKDFLVKFIEINGYNPVDVLGGALWALVGIGRKVGFDETTALTWVRDCYQRHREQEAIDSAAGNRTVS